MNEPLLAVDTFETEAPLQLDPGYGGTLNLPAYIASRRAYKATLNNPITGVSYDEVFEALQDGREEEMRRTAAAKLDAQRQNYALRAVSEVAGKRNEPLSASEADFVRSVAYENYKPTDPRSVFEVSYAKQYMDYLNKVFPEENIALNDAIKYDSKSVDLMKAVGATYVAKKEFLTTLEENSRTLLENQSYFGRGIDILKSVVPGYNEIKLRGNIPDVGFLDGLGLGSNLEEQAVAAFNLPFDQFKDTVLNVYNELKQDNPYLAHSWISALIGQSATEKNLNNVFTLLDTVFGAEAAVSVARFGKSASKVAKAMNETKDAVKDVVKASHASETNPSTVLAAAGDVGSAAVSKVAAEVVQDFKMRPKTPKQNTEELVSAFRSDAHLIEANPGNLSREVVTRIKDNFLTAADNIVEVLNSRFKPNVTPFLQASEEAVRAVKDSIKDLYPGLRNSLIDLKVSNQPDILTGLHEVEIILGKPRGEFFTSWTVADNYAKANGLLDYRIKKQGFGHYISVTKPINLTDDLIRDVRAATSNPSPKGFLQQWVAWLRTPEDTLSVDNKFNRKIANFGIPRLMELAQAEADYIRKVSKGFIKVDPNTGKQYLAVPRYKEGAKRWDDFMRILEIAREKKSKIDGKPGYFFRDPFELSEAYQNYLKRTPDDVEVEAYFSFVRMNELDRVLRNLRVYTNKLSVGVEQWTLSVADKAGKKINPGFFDAVLRKEMPREGTVFIAGRTDKEGQIADLGRMWRGRTKTKDGELTEFGKLVEDIKQGKKQILELHDPDARPLKGFARVKDSDRPQYIIADTFQSKPLTVQQVERRGGGHWEYDYDYYLKQARIRVERIGSGVNAVIRKWYDGDQTLMPVALRKLGVDVEKHINEVRKLLLKGDNDAAKEYSNKNLHVDWDEVKGWFEAKKVNGVQKLPLLALDEPIRLVPKGKMIADLDSELSERHGSLFRDARKRGSLARQHQIEYTAERDSFNMRTINDVGSKDNPIYKYEPAKFVDPITTIDRALTRISNSTFMDDYKKFSIEEWLAEATPFLKADKDDIRRAPFWHYNHPEFRNGVEQHVKQGFLARKYQIDQFLGVKNTTDNFLHSVSQRLADSIYGRFGPKGLIVDPVEVLPKLKDPFRFIRSFTFHTAMGLFAIPQLWVQAQTFVVIGAVAGARYSVPGTVGAIVGPMLNLNRNPAILKKIDDLISKMDLPGIDKWKPGEFAESWKLLQDSGFNRIAGNYATLDDITSPGVIGSFKGDLLHAGTWPFRTGEQAVKHGAWHTAYKEFRAAKPHGRITEADKAAILDRADTLAVNMSRASNSALHSGILSIPTQFLTYQLRLMELFLGKRLTSVEKARLFGVSAAIYGIPSAFGVTGFPLGDTIRSAAMEQGYVIGDNYINSVFMEGLPSMIGALITGDGNIEQRLQTGNWYNFGDRFGANGLELMRNIFRSDVPVVEFIGGAAYNKIGGTLAGFDGFSSAVMSFIKGDEKFPLKAEDFLDPLREVSSWSSGKRLYIALNTGRIMSKNELYLDDTSALNALWMAATGLQDQRLSDIYIKSISIKDRHEVEKEMSQRFTREWRRGLMDMRDGNQEAAHDHFIRARSYLVMGGVREDKWASIISKASKDYESLINSINWNYYITTPKQDERQQSIDTFIRQQSIIQQRMQNSMTNNKVQ